MRMNEAPREFEIQMTEGEIQAICFDLSTAEQDLSEASKVFMKWADMKGIQVLQTLDQKQASQVFAEEDVAIVSKDSNKFDPGVPAVGEWTARD